MVKHVNLVCFFFFQFHFKCQWAYVHFTFLMLLLYICSAQSENLDNSGIALRKVENS